MKPPKPETKTAILYNAAVQDFTLHRFVEARPWLVPGVGGGQGFEFIFECTETGFERRWGYALNEPDAVEIAEEGN